MCCPACSCFPRVLALRDPLIRQCARQQERVLNAGDPLIGKQKGAVQIAKERDVYVKGMSMKGPKLRDATAAEREERAMQQVHALAPSARLHC